MPFQLLRDAIAGPAPRMVFVCGTRLSEEQFWKRTLTGLSLARISKKESVSCSITFNNKEGLPLIYNRAIQRADPHDILIFAHDDIWINENQLANTLRKGLRTFAVCGVAGCRKRSPRQRMWMFKDEDQEGVSQRAVLSGEVSHGTPGHSTLTTYGPWPSPCELMDGVFLAAKADVLQRAKVSFDERFDFHFYDLDFCRSAQQAGLRIGTWPIKLIHESGGRFAGDQWNKNCEKYFEKWKN